MHTIAPVTTSTTAFLGALDDGGPLYEAQPITSAPSGSTVLAHALTHFFIDGGSQAWVVRVPDAGVDLSRAISALDDVPSLNLVAMPDLAASSGDASLTALSAIASYCATRGAFFLVDPPSAWTSVDDVVQQIGDVAAVVRENGAIYWPPLVDGSGAVPPSGAVAGVYTTTDAQSGVWTVPAGTRAVLAGVSPTVALNDAQNGELNPLGVNAIRMFPVFGTVVWGARTLAGADSITNELRYVQVRRTIIYIEQSIKASLQWTVFEPNAQPLWSAIAESVNAFLTSLWSAGALYGSRPNDAFFVRCDATTTTQEDIDAGIVNIVVGVALLQPAEFVILQISAAAQSPYRSS